MHSTKMLVKVTDTLTPNLVALVERVTPQEYKITISQEFEPNTRNPRAIPASYPRFDKFVEPTLYVPPCECMDFLVAYARDTLYVAATYLTGTGEYYVE